MFDHFSIQTSIKTQCHGFSQLTPDYPAPRAISGSSSGLTMEVNVQGVQGNEVLVGLGHLGPAKLVTYPWFMPIKKW